MTFEEELDFIVLQTNREFGMANPAIERLKQKAAHARNVASTEIKEFEADLDGLIAEGPKLKSERQAAVAPHREAVDGLRGEYDGMREAMNILSNGGPPLEESEDAGKKSADARKPLTTFP